VSVKDSNSCVTGRRTLVDDGRRRGRGDDVGREYKAEIESLVFSFVAERRR